MENTREKNKRADGRKKTYFDRENKKKAARTEKTKSVAPEKGKQKEFIIVEMSLSEKMRRMHISEPLLRRAAREKRAVPEEDSEGHRPGQRHGWHGKSLSLPE